MKCVVVISIVALGIAISGGVSAGPADVVAATASQESSGTWRFRVTVRHDDTGWDHYADRWDVVAPDGRILGTRVLLHPHEDEQPFTRALGGVVVPDDVDRVTVRAHDSVHGLGGAEVEIQLQR